MLYKYCKTDGFDILLKARLLTSRLEKLNDPFELVFGVDRDSAPGNIRKELINDSELTKAWRRLLKENKVLYDTSSFDDLVEKVTKFLIDDLHEASQKVWDSWSKSMGIFSLSECADIIQMWSHYADNHKGIVVGIDENKITEDKTKFIQVKCVSDMALFPITATHEKIKHYEQYFERVIERKENNWAYEKEVRLYSTLEDQDLDGNYYVHIHPSSIKELYLGLYSGETSEIIARSIKERKEYNHLRVYKMCKHESKFQLLPKEIK